MRITNSNVMKTIVILAFLTGSLASAQIGGTLQFTATLNGTNEVPANTSTYVGSGTFTLTGNSLEYSVGMLSLFFFPTSAGIYGPTNASQNAPLIFDLGNYIIAAPHDEFPGSLGYIGTLTLTPQQISDLKAGQWYMNFASSAYPSGEIRGQILPEIPSIEDLCPCNGHWKNHGEYVKCVRIAATALVQEGLITEAEKRAIVRQAAESDCGISHSRRQRVSEHHSP
jgi:CHRD domain